MKKLDVISLYKCRRVSQKWKALAENNQNWKEYLFEKNYSPAYLSKFNNSYMSIFKDGLKKVPTVTATLRKNLLEAIKLVEIDILNTFEKEQLEILISNNGIAALKEKLIVAIELISISPVNMLLMLSDNGLTALRERLITTQQVRNIRLYGTLESLFSNHGLTALRSEPMTDERIEKLNMLANISLP